jgi:hypothetical protein
MREHQPETSAWEYCEPFVKLSTRVLCDTPIINGMAAGRVPYSSVQLKIAAALCCSRPEFCQTIDTTLH